MKNKLFWLIGIAVVFAAVALFFGSMKSAPMLWNLSGGGKFLFPLVVASAIVNSVHPCAFSILLVTIAFLFSVGQLRAGILKIGGMYIFGIFLAYVLIGMGVLQAFHLFDVPYFMAKAGAVILIALGAINLINIAFPKFPIKIGVPQIAHKKMGELMEKSSLAAAFLLGGLVGICALPCSGGAYVMVLGLLHDAQTQFRGFGYLIWYNLLFVSPLVVVLLLASQRTVLEKLQAWKRDNLNAVRLWGGVITVLLGLFIFFM